MTKFGYAIVIGFVAVLAGSLYLGYWFKNRDTSIPVIPVVTATSTPVVVATSTNVVASSTETTTDSSTITYKNTGFGFSLELPKSWEGYKVSTGTVEFGVSVTITPKSSTNNDNREFVPVLIYPISKWKEWEKDGFASYPTAAPIGPTERARNTDYVFATAPRYNFSFATGTEEVEEIVEKMKAF
jgi:hypothetical protein